MWESIISQTEQQLQLQQLQLQQLQQLQLQQLQQLQLQQLQQQSQSASSSCASLAQQQQQQQQMWNSNIPDSAPRDFSPPKLTAPIQAHQQIQPIPSTQQQNYFAIPQQDILRPQTTSMPLHPQTATSSLDPQDQQQNALAIPPLSLPRPYVTPQMGYTRVDWESIPDDQLEKLTDNDAAQRLGVTKFAVFKHRRSRNLPMRPKSTPKRTSKYKWASITRHQWKTLTNRQIALILGIQSRDNICVVAHYRRAHNLPKGPKRTPKYKWASITRHQWETLTNRQIARILGIQGRDNICYVAHYRHDHNLPKGPRTRRDD
ncbi:MAG: hypothetical protein RNU03_06300 [Candidatus Sedimenticola sp. (ex Thyasira tokunagai)]